VKKEMALPGYPNLPAKPLHEDKTMGSRLNDSDRSDLLRLENIARHHKAVGTAALSLEAGITPKRVATFLQTIFPA
jgi:hypothetical protein